MVESGLKLHSLLAAVDRRNADFRPESHPLINAEVVQRAEELLASLHQFDVIVGEELELLSEEELEELTGSALPPAKSAG